MPKVLWSDIVDGDHVALNGREWLVERIRVKGKRAKVTVRSRAGTFKREVKASARVEKLYIDPNLKAFTDRVKAATKTPLRNAENGQARWATEKESKRRQGLEPGDASVTKRPERPSGDPWETPRDRVEAKLDKLLGAVLVAEGDEAVGYYVPPVDVTTIASHLALMHPSMYNAELSEERMLNGHAHEHDLVIRGKLNLDTNHWHTKTRPSAK